MKKKTIKIIGIIILALIVVFNIYTSSPANANEFTLSNIEIISTDEIPDDLKPHQCSVEGAVCVGYVNNDWGIHVGLALE